MKTIGPVRTALLSVTLPLAAVASIPVLLFSFSGRKTANFLTGFWADLNCALIGLKVSLTGEEYLASPRPAVFVLNHQSNADGFLVAKLIRRDIAILGKREIPRNFITGPLMRWGGLVTVDRQDAADASSTMRALTDAIRKDGRSTAIFPEGTRSQSIALGEFKKGAFLIALRARVPIIPIEIHNSFDAQPRGETRYRPATVRVEVLAPIDTGSWKIKDLDSHVAAIHDIFLQVLGQSEGPDERANFV
jgi:putative phosphoserine phosphatase/1-acylglycerol-3-phosphate O-acyltransferase